MTAISYSRPVAPLRHTLIILGIMALIAVAGARNSLAQASPAAASGHVARDLSLIAAEWLLFYGIWRGLKAAGTPLKDVFGTGFGSWRMAVRLVLLGGVALAFTHYSAAGAHALLARLGAPVANDAANVQAAMAPHGFVERALWVVLSLSAGICEEFAYRGYLLRQFSAWFGGPVAGIVASGLVFGLSHAYQGPWQVIVIALGYGIPCGIVAVLTRSLVPTILAHAAEDVLAGFLGV